MAKSFCDVVSIAWLVFSAYAIWMVCRRKRRKLGLILLSIAVLTSLFQLFSVPTCLLASLERPFYELQISDASYVDAAVVCGGGWNASDHGLIGLEMNELGDRLLTVVELARSGRAREIVLGGGGRGRPPIPKDSLQVVQWIKKWQLVNVPITVLDASRNTHDEAFHTATLAQNRGWKTLYLITSASHMRRALATFRKTGLNIFPIACDFRTIEPSDIPRRWWPIPTTSSIEDFNSWIQEVFGLMYYKLRGWA